MLKRVADMFISSLFYINYVECKCNKADEDIDIDLRFILTMWNVNCPKSNPSLINTLVLY